MTIGEPQHLGQRSAHDHFARMFWDRARNKHRVVLLHHRLDPTQTVVRTENDFHKRAGVAVCGFYFPLWALPSVFDHQKILWKSARRACIFVSVEPLRSKNTLGFHLAISAAHSYSGLPQCAPSTVIFGKRRAISSR